MTMGFSSVNCASGNSALAGGVVGTFINIPFLGDFGPIMGGALTGYATETVSYTHPEPTRPY